MAGSAAVDNKAFPSIYIAQSILLVVFEAHQPSHVPVDNRDDGENEQPGDPKKKRHRGAGSYESRFDEEWTKNWPYIVKANSTTQFR